MKSFTQLDARKRIPNSVFSMSTFAPSSQSSKRSSNEYTTPKASESGFTRDFSRIPLHNSTMQNESNPSDAARSCPLSPDAPRTCPFGGACHSCPTMVQAKLTINKPGDIYEQEADRVAEQVMRMEESNTHHENSGVSLNLQRSIQRKCSHCKGNEDKDFLQMKSVDSVNGTDSNYSEKIPQIVNDVIHSPGEQLDSEARAFFEPRFNHDFSQVRLHTDAKAGMSAKMVNALAYTVGNNIVLGSEQYAPSTSQGRWLIGHELTHVLQQQSGISTINSPETKQQNPIHENNTEIFTKQEKTDSSFNSKTTNLKPAPVYIQRAIDISKPDSSLKSKNTELDQLPSSVEAEMTDDLQVIVSILKDAHLQKSKQEIILSLIRKWSNKDNSENPIYLKRFLTLLKLKNFYERRFKTLWWTAELLSVFDEIWRRFDKQQIKEFQKFIILAKSDAIPISPPELKEEENVLSYIAKREAIGLWMIAKGLGMSLTGLVDTALWAFWKTAPGMPLGMVLKHFNIDPGKFKLSEYLDLESNFDQVAKLIAKAEGVDINEKLIGDFSLYDVSDIGGKVVGNLATARGIGLLGDAGIAVGAIQAMQSVEQLNLKIQELQKLNPELSIKEIMLRPDILADLVGIIGAAVGAKTSMVKANSPILKLFIKIGLGLNVAQLSLLVAAYQKIDEDTTLKTPEDKQKKKNELLVQIITNGFLIVDQKYGPSFNHPKKGPAETQSVKKTEKGDSFEPSPIAEVPQKQDANVIPIPGAKGPLEPSPPIATVPPEIVGKNVIKFPPKKGVSEPSITTIQPETNSTNSKPIKQVEKGDRTVPSPIAEVPPKQDAEVIPLPGARGPTEPVTPIAEVPPEHIGENVRILRPQNRLPKPPSPTTPAAESAKGQEIAQFEEPVVVGNNALIIRGGGNATQPHLPEGPTAMATGTKGDQPKIVSVPSLDAQNFPNGNTRGVIPTAADSLSSSNGKPSQIGIASTKKSSRAKPPRSTTEDIASVHKVETEGTGTASRSPSGKDELNQPDPQQVEEVTNNQSNERLGLRKVWEPPLGAARKPSLRAPLHKRVRWLRIRLKIHVDQAIERFSTEGFSPGQEAALERAPNLARAFRGSRIDKFAKESILQDPELAEIIAAPDFINEPDIIDSIFPTWFDITTRAQWAAHVSTYGRRYGTTHGVGLWTDVD